MMLISLGQVSPGFPRKPAGHGTELHRLSSVRCWRVPKLSLRMDLAPFGSLGRPGTCSKASISWLRGAESLALVVVLMGREIILLTGKPVWFPFVRERSACGLRYETVVRCGQYPVKVAPGAGRRHYRRGLVRTRYGCSFGEY